MRFCGSQILAVAAAVSGAAWLAGSGCQRPLDRDSTLQAAVDRAIARELEAAPPTVVTEDPQQPDTAAPAPPPAPDVFEELAQRRDELEALGPLGSGTQPRVNLGTDLANQQQQAVQVRLQDAIQSAVTHNLGIQISQLQPAIALEDIIIAQAVFDTVLFSNVDLAWIDQPQRVPVLGGQPLGSPQSSYENFRFETGVRQRFGPGTEAFVSTDVTRFHNRAPGIMFSPDPAYTGAVNVGVTQPVLRGFGSEVNTANILLARNQQRRTVQQVQRDLLQVVADTERAYWDLDTAWKNLAIAQWLVDVGVEVRDIMDRRREFDIRPAQFSDAIARVEQRQSDVIRARRAVRAASDALKAFMNDPQIPVSSEAVLQPLDSPVEAPVTFSLREAILNATDHRPELRAAALEIDDAAIRQRVARSDRLPLLNLSAQASFYGLDDSVSGAYSGVGDAEFIDYLLGLAFEWPWGSRAGEAALRAARLQRTAAVLNFQRTLQSVVLDVKNALRDVVTNMELIRATQSFRIAQAENLRTLLVEEELLAALTPEFLNLKFQRQETLAQARRQEVEALADFNRALAALYRAMGTGLQVRNLNVEIVEGAAQHNVLGDQVR